VWAFVKRIAKRWRLDFVTSNHFCILAGFEASEFQESRLCDLKCRAWSDRSNQTTTHSSSLLAKEPDAEVPEVSKGSRF
jgi:hypothetical protein